MSSQVLLADPEQGWLDDVIDRDLYPIGAPGEAELVERVRSELDRDGAVTLTNFVRPEALTSIADEIGRLSAFAPIRRHHSTVYARTDLEAGLDPTDCRRTQLEWIAGHVTRDMIPPHCGVHRLYASPEFKRFVAQCVGHSRIFEYADPLAGLIATIIPPGGQYPWHYDTNEFVVTLVVQQPESGGDFEYCPDLRSPHDENLAGLARVLDGSDTTSIRSTSNRPGDLQLFRGRYSLHRVTEVGGTVPRHVVVLSYSDRPGVIGPLDRTRAVYGRVTEAHLLAAEASIAGADWLIL